MAYTSIMPRKPDGVGGEVFNWQPNHTWALFTRVISAVVYQCTDLNVNIHTNNFCWSAAMAKNINFLHCKTITVKTVELSSMSICLRSCSDRQNMSVGSTAFQLCSSSGVNYMVPCWGYCRHVRNKIHPREPSRKIRHST